MVQLIHLKTVKAPNSVVIYHATERGQENVTDSFLGPYNEHTELLLVCQAGGGRPTPSITWRLGQMEVRNSTCSLRARKHLDCSFNTVPREVLMFIDT